MLVVEFPGIEVFANLIRSRQYKAILPHRLSGISDTRLMITGLMPCDTDFARLGEGGGINGHCNIKKPRMLTGQIMAD